MRLADRVRAWALRRLPSRRGAATIMSVDRDGLALAGATPARVAWSDVERVVATLAGGFAGDVPVLVFGLADGRGVTLSEADPAFPGLADRLHLHLAGARRRADWALEAMASPGAHVEVFRR